MKTMKRLIQKKYYTNETRKDKFTSIYSRSSEDSLTHTLRTSKILDKNLMLNDKPNAEVLESSPKMKETRMKSQNRSKEIRKNDHANMKKENQYFQSLKIKKKRTTSMMKTILKWKD
jgi:hypothetical protein